MPLQVQICNWVPSVVLELGSSRQSPDSGLTSDPFAPAVHCCAPVPLHGQYWTLVPAEVPLEVTSRQPPSTWSVPLLSTVQLWAPVPLQSQIWIGVPAEVLEAVDAQTGIELERRHLHLDEPIKTTGTHHVSAKLHPEVEFQITVEVSPS